MEPAPAKYPEHRSKWRPRIALWAAAAFCILFIPVICLVVNNNYSLGKRSRAEFVSQVDQAIESSTQWIVQHPEIQGNPSIMYMVGDMADVSRDPRLQQFVASYVTGPRVHIPGKPITWYYARLADPTAPVPPMTEAEANAGWELLWSSYATAPQEVLISPAERANMFSTTKYVWGHRNHQLLTLDIYRHFNGDSPELKAAINPVSEGVARDGFWDFRVSDSYEQRSAFLLAAGRPDLVKKRWIERILANQQPDGAWNYCWYGWCRGVLEFRSGPGDQGHSTVQAAWALYQLKYHYSDWITQQYQ